MGKFKISGTAGKRAMVEFEFDGVWQTPTAASVPSFTLPTYLPPILAGMTFTINSVSVPRWSKITLDGGQKVSLREDVGAVDGSSAGTAYHSAIVVDREIKLNIDPELVAQGTKDWFADQRAATQYAINMVASRASAGGTIVTIAGSKLQTNKSPNVGDRDGKAAAELDFTFNATNGDDEITFTLT